MNRLFYLLSKTNYKLIRGCSKKAKYAQASLGMFVLSTGVVAFFSGTYALKMAFDLKEDDISKAIIGGLIYSLIIMAFDREIVAAKNKLAIAVRIPLAIMIGVIVSVPIELSVLEGRINEQLGDESKEKNQVFFDIRINAISLLDKEESKLRTQVFNLEKEIKKWDSIKRLEKIGDSDLGIKAGEGREWRNAVNKSDSAKKRLDTTLRLLKDFLIERKIKERKVDSLYKASISFKSYDLLSRYIALKRLQRSSDLDSDNKKEEAKATKQMSWALMLLIIFIELFPALMKLFKEDTDYDDLQYAQSQMNSGIINIKANHRLDTIEQNPSKHIDPDAIKSIQDQMEVMK